MEMVFKAENMKDLFRQLKEAVDAFLWAKPDTLQQVPTADAGYGNQEPIKPVITMDQAEKNVEEAPKHELPPQPTMEEARAALNALRGRKGAAAVKALLAEYDAERFTDLAPEAYLQVIDRANVM